MKNLFNLWENVLLENPLYLYIMRTQPGYQKYSFAQKVKKELCIELFNMKTKDRPLLMIILQIK